LQCAGVEEACREAGRVGDRGGEDQIRHVLLEDREVHRGATAEELRVESALELRRGLRPDVRGAGNRRRTGTELTAVHRDGERGELEAVGRLIARLAVRDTELELV